MTAVLDATPDAPADDTTTGGPLASWPARAGAFAVDVLLGVAVIATMALLTLTAPQRGWLWWVFTAAGGADVVADGGQQAAAADDYGLESGPGVVRHRGPQARRLTPRGVAVASSRRRASARHRSAVRRVAVAAVGPPPPHVRRSAAAHRGARRRPAAARYASPGCDSAAGGDAGVRGGRGAELPGGVPARPRRRYGPRADRRTGTRGWSNRC